MQFLNSEIHISRFPFYLLTNCYIIASCTEDSQWDQIRNFRMAKKQKGSTYTEQEFDESLDPSFRALLNQQVKQSGLDINSYELFNNLLKEERGKRLYISGEVGPVSALKLHLEAERSINHSAKLWRNMVNAARTQGLTLLKKSGFENHHVVAARAAEAWRAREIIFNVGIGINDYRNGVHIRGRPEHRDLHADFMYYSKVYGRLFTALKNVKNEIYDVKQEHIGKVLVAMANEIENGIF